MSTSTTLKGLLSYLLFLSLFFTQSWAKPVSSNERRSAHSSGTFAITGLNSSAPRVRLEIRDLYANKDLWNLYLLALRQWKMEAQTGQFSWYGIMGIHGVPNVAWDGVTPNPKAQSEGAVGYCTHSMVLFPSWHRVYTALYEQVLYKHVNDIAAMFQDSSTRSRLMAAAKTFAAPYWDWAATPPNGENTNLPAFMNTENYVPLVFPNGKTQQVLNPLKRYAFHPLVPADMLTTPWSLWNVTKRWPTNNSSANAMSQPLLAQRAVDRNRHNLRDNVYNLFTQCSDFGEFSNDASATSTPGCSTSLESVHDDIHSYLGGPKSGHMAWLWWSAFDPIFFLHHSNVDRLFALWQAIYPSEKTPPQKATGPTLTIVTGDELNNNSPLTPFHSDTKGTFWTPSRASNHLTFHYTYPEFTQTDGSPSAIRKVVNNLYGPQSPSTAGKSRASPSASAPVATPSAIVIPGQNITGTPAGGPPIKLPNSVSFPDAPIGAVLSASGNKYEYVCNINAQRFGLDGPFTVFVFLGDNFSEDPETWPFSPALVGSHGFFSQSGMSHHKISVSGAVPLTRALTENAASGLLSSLSNAVVVPFLKHNLHWRVAANDGSAVPPQNVPGLSVTVAYGEVSVPGSAEEFPVVQKSFSTLVDITKAKAGGNLPRL